MSQESTEHIDGVVNADSEAGKLLLNWAELKQLENVRLLNRRRTAFLDDDENRDPDLEAAADADIGDSGLNDVVGLAISGGGLRSATFNDGMLTAFSHKGLLRYVDYVSAVSGGAYITGNLLCRGKEFAELRKKESNSFHDAEVRVQNADNEDQFDTIRPSELGVDRLTGQPDSGRLEGIGRYLNHKSSLACSHLLEFLCRLLVYVGITGALASIVAIFWRSMDRSAFRHLYFDTLGLGTTNELGIAFLPTLWITVCIVIATLAYRSFNFGTRMAKIFGRDPERFSKTLSTFAISAIGFSVIASTAIFLGNGYTGMSSGTQTWFELEDWALRLGIVAAVFQILVFLGRERLLRSEHQAASRWQKIARTTILTSAVCAAVFFAIYFVGRENISHYVSQREQDIVPGEVLQWRKLIALNEEHWRDRDSADDLARFLLNDAEQRGRVFSKDSWEDYQRKHDGLTHPKYSFFGKIPPAYRSQSLRLLATPYVWWLSLSPPVLEKSELKTVTQGQLYSLRGSLQRWQTLEKAKERFLAEFNEEVLPNKEFHLSLLKDGELAASLQDSEYEDSSDSKSLKKSLFDAVKKRMPKWSSAECQEFTDDCLRVLDGKQPLFVGYGRDNEKDELKTFGRLCIHVVEPEILIPHGLVSTKIVAHEDQLARIRWLFWFLLTAISGLIISAFSPSGSLYRFYRNSIANHFLNVSYFSKQQATDSASNFANQEIEKAASSFSKNRIRARNRKRARRSNSNLTDFDLTDIGFPVPIINCAEVYIDEKSREVVADSFVMTPHYVGSENHGIMPTGRYTPGNHIGKPYTESNVPISDAICISGAALSTQMSRSFGTRMIMDLFGVNLGRFLIEPNKQRPDSTGFLNELNPVFWRRWNGYFSKIFNLWAQLRGRTEQSRYRHIADGGFSDYLGVMELLKRQCRLIIVSDAGINTSDDELQHLARMLEKSKKELGIQFFDLDHDVPLNFERLDRKTVKDEEDENSRADTVAPQQFVCMRIRYPGKQDEEAYLIYAQMVICEDDPLEIRQIRQKFPDFPDEPTTNQFFTQQQVDAYHRLGYYIGSLICSEMEPWSASKIVDSVDAEKSRTNRWHLIHRRNPNSDVGRFDVARDIIENDRCQPLFGAMLERLLLGYRMACYREKSHSTDDVFSEAIWQDDQTHFPHFSKGVDEIKAHFQMLTGKRGDPGEGKIDIELMQKLIDHWMVIWETNADIRNAYRDAVFQDINLLNRNDDSEIAQMQKHLWEALSDLEEGNNHETHRISTTLHLAAMAMACQQFHTGWLGKIFQIGGRKKLVSLIAHIGEQICVDEELDDSPEEQIATKLRNLCPSLLEMQTCVFRHGCQNVVVSFAVCLSVSVNLIKHPKIHALRIDWCNLSDFITEFDKALESRSRTAMVGCLKLLSDSVQPQFAPPSAFPESEGSTTQSDASEDIGQILG